MTTEDFLARTERLAELERFLASPEWAAVRTEAEKRIARLRVKACDLGETHAHRDGAAGAANELQDLLDSYGAQVAALSATVDNERKTRRLRKLHTHH